MTGYRRNFIPGGSYFFTVNLADRRLRLLAEHIELLRSAFRDVKATHPFTVEATVVLPDHLHALWTMPEGDADFAMRWRLIKAGFSRALPRGERVSISRAGKGERGIWQRRYWEHTLRDERDFERHVDYIHFNPVKHGHANRVSDWPYSTFHRMVKLGIYPEDWAGDAGTKKSGFGERPEPQRRRLG
ncbi:MAG TPA: transposase [Xanthobacteraceae bacterium]|jgi:putative transposase|nr:transposase [Xanthobacteraceae bacterium]